MHFLKKKFKNFNIFFYDAMARQNKCVCVCVCVMHLCNVGVSKSVCGKVQL